MGEVGVAVNQVSGDEAFKNQHHSHMQVLTLLQGPALNPIKGSCPLEAKRCSLTQKGRRKAPCLGSEARFKKEGIVRPRGERRRLNGLVIGAKASKMCFLRPNLCRRAESQWNSNGQRQPYPKLLEWDRLSHQESTVGRIHRHCESLRKRNDNLLTAFLL